MRSGNTWLAKSESEGTTRRLVACCGHNHEIYKKQTGSMPQKTQIVTLTCALMRWERKEDDNQLAPLVQAHQSTYAPAEASTTFTIPFVLVRERWQ